MQSKVLYSRAAIGDVDGTALYALPASFQQLIRCTWDDRTIPQLTETELSRKDKKFETLEGDVIGYTLDDITGQLRKWKVPSATDATKFQIEFYSRGTALSADATEFDIPVWMVDIVEYRTVSKLLSIEGDGQDLEGAAWWMKRYEQGKYLIGEKKKKLLKFAVGVMGGSVTSATRLPYPVLPHAYSGPKRVR
jgi:hypothetical protein